MSGSGNFTATEYARRLTGVWLDDFGVVISESFVVTEGGGKRLCDLTRDPIAVDGPAA